MSLALHLLEGGAAQGHPVRRPQLVLEATLIDDVALVGLYDLRVKRCDRDRERCAQRWHVRDVRAVGK